MKTAVVSLFIFMVVVLLIAGCGSRFSSLLSESWSENYALAAYGTAASHPEINDGDLKTWGVTRPPKRVYTITFPEERKVDKIVVYSGNVVSYRLFYWDRKADGWKIVGVVDSVRGRQQAYIERSQLKMPKFVHRVNCKTDKIRLQVIRAQSDKIITTRTPGKNDKILNHRVDYIGTGRRRIRVDLYDIFRQGPAAIREIEVYSHLEKTK